MKRDIFRSVTFWKSTVMLMPDTSFFELLRSVFGKIKTPFNKQQLLNDLEKFLLRKEIQQTITAYIDETDAKIIAAVSLFGEPVPEQLVSFFHDEISYPQLQDIIVNLEERFILYRFTEEKIIRLALNPVLKTVLIPFLTNTGYLFPTAPANKTAKTTATINDLTLTALYSFISSLETRKGIRKLPPETENLLNALQIIGLFYIEDNKPVPDKKRFDDFCLLTPKERALYCVASLYIYSELTPPFEILPPLFRNKVNEIINLVHSFLGSLKAELQYPDKTLKRMIEILKAQTKVYVNAETLLEIINKTNLITGEEKREQKKTNEKPVIVIDSGFSVLVYPEINFADSIKLSSFLNLQEASAVSADSIVRFKLDKDSAIRAFDNNVSADEITELLIKLSGGKVNETLIWNLKDWEKRHSEVSLKKGIILQLTEEHRYLTETKSIAALITETLAPGVYLLKENSIDDAVINNTIEALQKAGIDIVSRRKEKKETASPLLSYFPSPSSQVLAITDTLPNENVKPNKTPTTNDFHTALHTTLEKLPLSELVKTELSARIDRKLVLSEAQLKDANIRYEKLEARLMDYTGKQNIAKQAISQQSPVEIVWTIKGKEKSIFGIPQALSKEGSDLILIIDNNRIPLAKISLLRRIKKSIFET